MKGGVKKKGSSTFVIGCVKPVEDKIMEIASVEKFLQERIKVAGGKAGAPDDAVTVTSYGPSPRGESLSLIICLLSDFARLRFRRRWRRSPSLSRDGIDKADLVEGRGEEEEGRFYGHS
ncbi:hypothetical protein LUZ61_018616 [Rhynchospora tenuis]|uniref:Large ribosomal subunit protein eL22 n=1 Tax=Rhynchospora tenuis TaxID=198213 RepID=A0AAD5Z9K0_9POAL|nr:hypothetical protein LUZ61_018616 [Rhynchospora tenuis]